MEPVKPPSVAVARRRHPRISLAGTAQVSFVREPLGPGVVEDMSASGMRVVLRAPVQLGRMVSVQIDLPGSEPFKGLAQVARHSPRAEDEHALGLSFLELPSGEIDRLEALIAHRLSETYPSVEFFDTSDDGRRHRLVLTDDLPVVD